MREYFVALAEMLASLEQGRQVDAELIIRLDGLKFGTDYEAAQAAYAEAELANGDVDATLDIVLLSADSLETIEQTHSSYFGGDSKKLEELLPR